MCKRWDVVAFSIFYTLIGLVIGASLVWLEEMPSQEGNTDQPEMTAEISYLEATALSDMQFEGDSLVGTVLVEMKCRGREKRTLPVTRDVDIKAEDNVFILRVTFSPSGTEIPMEFLVAVTKQKTKPRW